MPYHGGGFLKPKVHTVATMVSLDKVGHKSRATVVLDPSKDQTKAAVRSMQKAMDASDRKRAQVLQRKRQAQPTTATARWINGWTPEHRCHLQPEAVKVQPPAAGRTRKSGSQVRRASADGSLLGPQHSDWFEVESSRVHTGSMPSWYTAAVDAGPVSADGRLRMAVFHRSPPSSSSEFQGWARTGTASGSPPISSAGDVAVEIELSGGVNGTFDATGNWRPRKPGDDVLTTTVAAVNGVQARGAATATEERPPSAATLRPRRQPSPLRTRRPASAVAVAQGQGQPEVLEWLAVAQLDSQALVDEAESLLSKKRSDERPQSVATQVAGLPVPVAIVEPTCIAHTERQREDEGVATEVTVPLEAAGGTKRGVPRRPWVREEVAALSVSQTTDALTLTSTEARADAERASAANSILETVRTVAEADRRRRQSGVSADGVRVVKVTRRSYDNGVGYKSLLRPSERADGRPTWGLLEWPAAANVPGLHSLSGSRTTTWGS